jgi:rare lipoprotein A
MSYYADGQKTANGEQFDPNAFTAANKTLPFNTRVRITNPANGKSVVVRINDRGPFVAGRCFDLSRAAFAAIASLSSGVLSAAKYEVLS